MFMGCGVPAEIKGTAIGAGKGDTGEDRREDVTPACPIHRVEQVLGIHCGVIDLGHDVGDALDEASA